MATCNNCGEEIEFRYVNGRCVPIHPGGGWHCGSWSGSQKTTYHHVSVAPTREWREQDFTRPTTCPECGADVFFIRHNGGSVWVDELGWPWPKHACFDHPTHETSRFSLWSAKSSGLSNAKLGIVIRIKSDPRQAEPRIEIRLTDSSEVSLTLRWTPPDSALLGNLVIISEEDNLLLHPKYAEIPFHSLVWIGKAPSSLRTPGNLLYCLKCGQLYPKHAKYGHRCPTKSQAKRKQKPPRLVPDLHASQKPTPRATPSDAGQIEERIQAAIVSIAAQAWTAVAALEPHRQRLKQAKQEVLRLVRTLPPDIKGQVEHRFISQKWAPLLAHAPKN